MDCVDDPHNSAHGSSGSAWFYAVPLLWQCLAGLVGRTVGWRASPNNTRLPRPRYHPGIARIQTIIGGEMLAAVCRMPRGFQHHVYAVVAWAPHE